MSVMSDRPDRLVKRIQIQIQSVRSDSKVRRPASRDIASLESRVRLLKDMGDGFAHVGLSPYVTFESVALVLLASGEC